MISSSARSSGLIVNLGIFAADTTFRARRMPQPGETILGEGFALGPGGKGSNQSVAAARAGGAVHFITRLGKDAFAELAHRVWAEAGVTAHTREEAGSHTGAAFIYVDAATGENAIIVTPGAAGLIGPEDAEANAALIAGAAVFMTQLEQPLPAARRGLEIARAGGALTLLNPAPAAPVDDALLALCDILTPNESEAAALTGLPVETLDEAARAAQALRTRGPRAVAITLGARGALWQDAERTIHIPALSAGPVVETTGAGDAFNGGFAVALAEGRDPVEAVRFGCATAALSVTRAGAAASMPLRAEIEELLSRG